MQVVWRSEGVDQDLDVALPPGATVADLLAVLTESPGPATVYVDGVATPAERPVVETRLCDGSVISIESPGPMLARGGGAELRVVGGLSAGGRWLLGPGDYRIGSAPECEIRLPAPGVDSLHARIAIGAGGEGFLEVPGGARVTVDGEVRRGRTRLATGAIIHVGQSIWEFARVDEFDWPENPCGAFNRPPRKQPGTTETEVRAPEPPAEPAAQPRPGWATLLVPLAMGGLFAVLFSPMMATFALLGPTMLLLNWYEDRRRVKKTRSTNAAEFDSALRRFGNDLLAAGSSHKRVLRTTLPDPPEVVRRALTAGPRLWERRPGHGDFMRVAFGTATIPWEPKLAGHIDDEDIAAVLADHAELDDAPVGIDLTGGTVVGIAGPRSDALGLARWVAVQVAVHHGPADVRIGVITDHPEDWEWTKWLPHTTTDPTSGRRLLGATSEDVDHVLSHVDSDAVPNGSPAPLTFLIVDADSLEPVHRGRLRSVQAGSGGPVAKVVIAPSFGGLPGVCGVVAEVSRTGASACWFSAEDRRLCDFMPTGLPPSIALECARRLAGLEDPEVAAAAVDLPDVVCLTDLLGGANSSPASILERWDSADPIPRIAGPVGSTERGALVIDLVHDGPHGLIAGTTGSGKSELLRSLIASFAASVRPDHLNFVLIDYKGGSAFDACAALPHVVGVVTDLDAHLGKRALTCLEAELRFREARLREVEAADLAEYLAATPAEPLPRLVVVIDEFAAMAAELPDFVKSLVDIAQRGRSLGVHLLLATQRPAGVVSESIRANTNLRIALRVHDRADSQDVLDDQAAASIPRGRAGRGYVRLGPGELIPFQAALVSVSGRGTVPVGVRPFRFGWEARDSWQVEDRSSDEPTDLARLVEAISVAAGRARIPPPRSPWPAELPEYLSLSGVIGGPGGSGPWWAPMGLIDEPHLQRQSIWGWEGTNLLMYGMPGSGVARALLTLGSSLAARLSPDRVHIYALDFGTRTLAPLEKLAQVGSVIGSVDRERQVRLLRHLQDEVADRRVDGPGDRPAVLLLLDNYGGFSASFDDPADLIYREGLRRIAADGPGVGVFVAMCADQATAVPANLAALIPEKLVFRMADPFDYATLGLPHRELPSLPEGRAVQLSSGLVMQIAQTSPSDLDRIAARSGSDGFEPVRIGALPRRSDLADVVNRAVVQEREWFLPIGIGDRRLEPVGWRLGEGDHVLVAGPARSGKSTALLAISTIVARHRPDVAITAMAPRRSPLRDAAHIALLVTDPDEVDLVVERVLSDDAPQLLLVDDADDVTDRQGVLTRLLRQRRPNIRVAGSGRADALRSLYGHWTQELRQSRQGIALRPQAEVDGELWNTRLPRHEPSPHLPGRGYLINEVGVELVQVALP